MKDIEAWEILNSGFEHPSGPSLIDDLLQDAELLLPLLFPLALIVVAIVYL